MTGVAPPRARERRGFLQTNRRLRVTRQGKVFVGISIALGAGVLNSGNNLLFLCLGLLLSIITVSGILSEWNVRDLRLEVSCDSLAFVGEPFTIELRVHNEGARRDVYSIVGNAFFVPVSPFVKQRRRVELAQPGSVLLVPKREMRSVRTEIVFNERGEYELDEVELQTEYPFGLFRKIRVFLRDVKVLVAPSPATPSRLAELPPTAQGAQTKQRLGSSIEPFDVREASPDEDIRNIAWAKSAGRQHLIAIRRAADATDAAIVAVAGTAGEPGFEDALRFATGCVLERMRKGAPTGLWLDARVIAASSGTAHERALLAQLARAHSGAESRADTAQRTPVLWMHA